MVPTGWWVPLVIVASVASGLLYIDDFGVFAIIPLALDAVLLWGVIAQHWTAFSPILASGPPVMVSGIPEIHAGLRCAKKAIWSPKIH